MSSWLRACTRFGGALVLLLLALACRDSRSEPVRTELGELRLEAALEPPAGRVGANHLWLELRDAEGRPLAGAELRVRVHMVAMGAMPAMGGPASVRETRAGAYRADFELSMGGTWIVEIDAVAAGRAPARAEGSLTVGTPGLRLRGQGSAPSPPAPFSEKSDARHPAEFHFDPARLQKIGVRTVSVVREPIGFGLRTVGRVTYDETRLADVAPKIRGWVEELHADAVGVRVERGEVLFTLYSPELYAAQEELLQALRSSGGLGGQLVRSARNRLRLWGVGPADIDELTRRGRALEAMPVRAPTSGYVIEKNVVEGSAVAPGQRLLRIAPLDRVWIDVDIYEAELAQIHEGQQARVTLSHLPGRAYAGKVAYLYPYLTGATRTARARIELENPELELRPDMFANVELQGEPREALVVPESAVLHAGERRFVFLALGEGRFRPQAVEIGLRDGERVEIVEGLSGGEEVVSSGTFLIASESRLRAGLEQW